MMKSDFRNMVDNSDDMSKMAEKADAFANIFREDMTAICTSMPDVWEMLDGSTVLVTGATGLLGKCIVNALLFRENFTSAPPRVAALVRSLEKAEKTFGGSAIDQGGRLSFIEGDVCNINDVPCDVDYIIHAASQTSSKGFTQAPVETIGTSVDGTRNMLKLAADKKIKGMAFLSTMEIYGYPARGHKVAEAETGALTPLNIRNCYPLSKQLCENLCCAYATEYGVPVKIVRLTQTFGPGVKYDDGRVFAEFARCIIEKKDIVLKTKGETERSYLYTADAASAIFTVLVKGLSGRAYNAANEKTYCSIKDMAALAASMGGVKVCFELQDVSALGYAGTLYMDLDTSALQALGWQPQRDMREMFGRMVAGMKAGSQN